MNSYQVVWNGTFERRHAETIRQAGLKAQVAAELPDFPTDTVFTGDTFSAKLERHIRLCGPGVVYTPRDVALLLCTGRAEAGTYLRRAKDHGLLLSLEPNPGARRGVKGGVQARYVSR